MCHPNNDLRLPDVVYYQKKLTESNGPMCHPNNDLQLPDVVSYQKNYLSTAQRAMERKMQNITLQDKLQSTKIRKRTQIIDIEEHILKQKWNWAGHKARMKVQMN